MSNDLIQEIEDSIKQERMAQLWQEYSSYIIAAAILAVLFTAGMSGWRSYDTRVKMADTEALLFAMDDADQADSITQLLETENLRGGHDAVGRLTAAGILMQEGKAAEALEQYRLLASHKSAPPLLRELGQYLAVRTAWSLDDTGVQAQDLIGEIMPVITNEKSEWRYHARILAAMIYAGDIQDYNAARLMLAPVLMEQYLPLSLIQQARALDQVYQELQRRDMAQDGMDEPQPQNVPVTERAE